MGCPNGRKCDVCGEVKESSLLFRDVHTCFDCDLRDPAQEVIDEVREEVQKWGDLTTMSVSYLLGLLDRLEQKYCPEDDF